MKKRVTAIGRLFFKAQDKQALQNWYQQHLGIECNEYGSVFQWREKENKEHVGYTVWSTSKKDSTYFNPSEKEFMFN